MGYNPWDRQGSDMTAHMNRLDMSRPKNYCQGSMSEFFYVFFSINCMDSGLILKSLVHFDFIFVYVVRK